jgi:hypothetical protein
MKRSRLLGAVCGLVLFILAPVTQASTIIISGDGTETCTQGPALGSGPCNVQTIDPATVWQQNNPGGSDALWISYADTGRPGTVTAPIGHAATFSETFSANAGSVLSLEVWADNTAAVVIDGLTVFNANFTSDAYCADGPIGCEAGEPGIINYIFQDAGEHTLSIDVYQGGSFDAPPGNPFGLLYTGSLTAVPIPAAVWLFGSGLLGLIGMARRKS